MQKISSSRSLHPQSNEAKCKHLIRLHLFFTVHTNLCKLSNSIAAVDRKYCHILSILDRVVCHEAL